MLFFKTEDKGKYIYFRRRKFTLSFALIPLICYAVLFPIIFFFFRTGIVMILIGLLIFLIVIFGIWMGIEGGITGTKISNYRKKGKKIEYETGKGIGISGVKVYK